MRENRSRTLDITTSAVGSLPFSLKLFAIFTASFRSCRSRSMRPRPARTRSRISYQRGSKVGFAARVVTIALRANHGTSPEWFRGVPRRLGAESTRQRWTRALRRFHSARRRQDRICREHNRARRAPAQVARPPNGRGRQSAPHVDPRPFGRSRSWQWMMLCLGSRRRVQYRRRNRHNVAWSRRERWTNAGNQLDTRCTLLSPPRG